MEAYLEHFVAARSTWLLILLLAGAVALLVKGADWLVEGAVGLSERLGVPKVIVGATVVSIGTTAPEAAVSVMAAFRGMPGLALGNSVGSIICDTGMIFGIACMVTHLPLDRYILDRHGWLQFGAGCLLVLAALPMLHLETWTSTIPRSAGFVFITLLVGYMIVSVVWARRRQKLVLEALEDIEEDTEESVLGRSMQGNVAMLLIGLLMVLAGSEIALPTVRELCLRWNVPESVVSATLVAFGTSLPELMTAISSIRKGHKELLIGNIIGADILNVLFVTGAAACTAPLLVEPLFFRLHFPVMLAILLLFRITVHYSKRQFARWPGAIFLGLHVFYFLANFFLGRG